MALVRTPIIGPVNPPKRGSALAGFGPPVILPKTTYNSSSVNIKGFKLQSAVLMADYNTKQYLDISLESTV